MVLRRDTVPALQPRFGCRTALPIHLFAHLDRGCLPLGTELCRARAVNYVELELDQPLSREMLNAIRPVPAPGPVPGVEWVDHVETDPIRALE